MDIAGTFPIKSWAQLDEENTALRARMAELEKENTALRGIIANLQGEKP